MDKHGDCDYYYDDDIDHNEFDNDDNDGDDDGDDDVQFTAREPADDQGRSGESS